MKTKAFELIYGRRDPWHHIASEHPDLIVQDIHNALPGMQLKRPQTMRSSLVADGRPDRALPARGLRNGLNTILDEFCAAVFSRDILRALPIPPGQSYRQMNLNDVIPCPIAHGSWGHGWNTFIVTQGKANRRAGTTN